MSMNAKADRVLQGHSSCTQGQESLYIDHLINNGAGSVIRPQVADNAACNSHASNLNI